MRIDAAQFALRESLDLGPQRRVDAQEEGFLHGGGRCASGGDRKHGTSPLVTATTGGKTVAGAKRRRASMDTVSPARVQG